MNLIELLAAGAVAIVIGFAAALVLAWLARLVYQEWCERRDARKAAAPKKPAVVISRSPLLDADDPIARAERAGRFADLCTDLLTRAERKVYGAGRHRAYGERDALMRALLTKTQAMFVGTLAAAGEEAPKVFGPREQDLRTWTQDELELMT